MLLKQILFILVNSFILITIDIITTIFIDFTTITSTITIITTTITTTMTITVAIIISVNSIRVNSQRYMFRYLESMPVEQVVKSVCNYKQSYTNKQLTSLAESFNKKMYERIKNK